MLSCALMLKTSESHPLRIDSVTVPRHGGRIGMTLCPGKIQRGALTGDWRRDLGADLAVIEGWGTKALVTLMEPPELARYGVASLSQRLAPTIQHYQLPIMDGSIPSATWEEHWRVVGPELRTLLTSGQRIVVHCRGGLGRTGLVVAKLLVELGVPSEQAIGMVRKARPGAIENAKQEEYIRRQKPAGSTAAAAPERPHYRLDPARVSRYRGCLLGGATGDALGAAVEFLSLAEIRANYGQRGIMRPDSAYGRVGALTDDTQMTLFTAEGLLRAHVCKGLTGNANVEGIVNHAYMRWLHTQGEVSRAVLDKLDGVLIGRRELFSRRAPGNTCISALRQRPKVNSTEPAVNESKGCGAVMRAAPIGLFLAGTGATRDEIFTLACKISALTHGHPTGQHPAGALALATAELVAGASVEDACMVALNYLAASSEREDSRRALAQAMELAQGGHSADECLRELGQGWVAEEALAIAAFCALRATSFEDGVRMAVNIDGDSDSTGAIAGNLLGAARGAHEIPEAWLSVLELRDLITEMADDLCSAPLWQLQASDSSVRSTQTEYWALRYPGW